ELNPLLIDQGASRHNDLIATRLRYVLGNHTAQHAITQRLDDVTAFDVRSHQQTLLGAAINLGHYQVLRHVDQTTGQITGVSGLQCGIRQTLTSAVGGNKVLEYVQPFTEVCGDRRFDDGTVRLGHQATHTSQLTDLRGGTTRTGVGHHVHGVERFLLDFVTVAINNLVLGQVGHHRLGDFIVGLRPQVDHLVVLLALGYQAGGILGFDFLHFVGGGINDASLLVRNLEVIDADGHAGNRRIGKTGVHQLVGENHGVLQTNRAVRLVDQLGDRFFLHRLVDDVVRQAFRHDLEQQRTTNS